MFDVTLTPELLIVIVSGLLAFVFEYFPKLKDWYDAQSEAAKKQIMLGLLVLTVAVVFAGSCFGLFNTGRTCEVKTALDFLVMVFVAIGVNQGVHKLTKKSAEG